MTARSTLSSTHHHHDITPTGTLREWVAAINPQVKDSWYVYPLVNVFSPFGEARDQAWAIKTSFTQNRFQWKFLGRDVLASPNDPPGPAFAQLTAFDILEAIDSLDLKKTRAYWCKVAINFFLLGLFAFLLIFLSPFMVSSLVDNFDPKTFPVSICLILGYGITGLCFLLHYKTRFFRTKIYISATKLEQLRLSILQYESSKTWGPRVKAIFKRIKEAEGLSSIVSLKDLVDVIFCQQKFISGLAKDLAEAEDLNNESVKELASMGTTIGQLRDRIKSLEHSLEEKASSLQKSQEELKEIRDSLSKEVSSLNSSMVKLQSELAASSVLYSHIQEENRKLADRLQTLTSSNFLMEAERERLNQELKEKENEKIDLAAKLSATEQYVASRDGSIKVPYAFLRNLVLQQDEPGMNESIALPILILTALSLRTDPPKSTERIKPTIHKRICLCAEIVRKHAESLPQYRGKLPQKHLWNTYVQSLETSICKILVPPNCNGKTASGSGSFGMNFSYLTDVPQFKFLMAHGELLTNKSTVTSR